MFRNLKKSDYPDFYKKYLDAIHKGYHGIISIDLETTGLDAKKDEVISFGCVEIEHTKILLGSQREFIFKTKNRPISNSTIHEILENQERKTFDDYLPQVLDLIGNKMILGHFIGFDLSMINAALRKMKLPKIKNPVIDTFRLALKKDGVVDFSQINKEEYSLYGLCHRYGIEVGTTHNALEDATLTALLYLHLIK